LRGARVLVGRGYRFHGGSFSRAGEPAGIGVAAQAAQIGMHVRGGLVAQASVFLDGLVDDAFELGRRVGPSGRAVGVDAAPRFIDQARVEAKAARAENVTFELADIEQEVTGGPYDHAYSRMGTMFFASPVIALRNIRRAITPGGRLVMAVWRKREANECWHTAELVVREGQDSAEKLTHSALQRASDIEKGIQELRMQRTNFRLQLQKMIELFQQVLEFDRDEDDKERPLSYMTRKPKEESAG